MTDAKTDRLKSNNGNKTVIGFWKINEKNGFLSQWYNSDFMEGDILFSTCEQYMMYKKALLFKDIISANNILKEKNPALIKKLGRKIKNFDEEKWIEERFNIIYQANIYKFKTNETLKKKLLESGDIILAEASPYDKIYGIGLKPNHPDVKNPNMWKGLNLLGKALMKVREELQE